MRSVKSWLVVAGLLVSALISACGPQPLERPQVNPQAPVNQAPGTPGTAPGGTPDGGTGIVPSGTPGAETPGAPSGAGGQ